MLIPSPNKKACTFQIRQANIPKFTSKSPTAMDKATPVDLKGRFA